METKEGIVKTESIDISKIIANPNNPRLIKDDKYLKLVQSIKDFPEMLQLRPIVVNSDMVVLGGNMRLRACKDAGLKKVPIIKAELLTAEQQKEFIIKDNVGFGEWDWAMIANEWDEKQLTDWGLDIPVYSEAKEFKGDLEEVFYLNIKFESEKECEKYYAQFKKDGFEVKIIT